MITALFSVRFADRRANGLDSGGRRLLCSIVRWSSLCAGLSVFDRGNVDELYVADLQTASMYRRARASLHKHLSSTEAASSGISARCEFVCAGCVAGDRLY